jgi:hypothetical protein
MNLKPNPKKVAGLHLVDGRRHDLGDVEHRELWPPRPRPRGTYTVTGPCDSQGVNPKPGQIRGLLCAVHGEGVRAADHQLLGESFVGQPGR